MALGNIALALIALFIPPLPVILKRGCGGHFLLNLLLVLLCWFPAVFHAWWIIAEDKDKQKQVKSRRRSGSRGSSGSRSRREKEGYAGPPPVAHGAVPPPQQGYGGYGHQQYPPPPDQGYAPGYGTQGGRY